MKKMNKIISTILALVMMLSLCVTGFAYNTMPASDDAQYSEKYIMALNTLYGLGVLSDNSPVNYGVEVSYESFVKYADALLDGRVNSIAQTENTDHTVTLGEAVQLLVDGTENAIRAEKYGYMGIAGQMGITHGLSRMQSYDPLTFGAVVQILYNSMRITPGDTTAVSANGAEYEYDSNRTVLTEYLEIDYKSGFVTADSFWSLNPDTDIEDGYMIISGKSYKVKYPEIYDVVGFYVNYYYSSEEDMILAIEKSANSKQVIIDSSDVTKFSGNEYTCTVDGKKENYKILEEAYVISNFEPVMGTVENMYPANSEIVLVDANGDNKYETVFIKSYTDIKVSVVNTDGELISGAGAGSYILSKDNPARVYQNGNRVDYKAVLKGLLASLVVDSDRVVREIYLSDKKVTGEVSEISSGDDKMEIKIGEETFIVSPTIRNKASIGVGTSGTFLIDFKGDIAYFENAAGTGGFGYLILVGREDGISRPAQMKIFAADGTFNYYDVSDKCKVNDARPTQDIVTLLTNNSGQTVQQLIYYELNAAGEISEISIPLDDDSTLSYDDYKLHRSLESKSGSYIRTTSVVNSLGEYLIWNDSTAKFSVPNRYSEEERDFRRLTSIGSSTSLTYNAYNFQKNDYCADAVVTYRNVADVYSGICGGPGPSLSRNDEPAMCVVTKASKGYVEEYDEYLDLIEFVNGGDGKTYSRILADNAKWQAMNGSRTADVVDYANTDFDLKPGDIFQYALNDIGEIGTVAKIFDASTGEMVKGRWTYTGDNSVFDYSDHDTMYGAASFSTYNRIMGLKYIVEATDSYVVMTRSGGPVSIDSASRDNLLYFPKDKYTYVYEVRVDGNNTEVKKISLGALTPAANSNEYVITCLHSGGRVAFLAVYKEPLE